MKRTVDAFDYAGHICKAMKKGILLTTGAGEQLNTMTIGWGHIGILWNRPTFIVYVRDSRHTSTMLDNHGEFTVNVPVGPIDGTILGVCGTKSGRDTDKIKDLNLTLEAPETISVPGIKELPLTLECKVLYKQDQGPENMDLEIQKRSYPPFFPDGRSDYHTVYYGQILNAYIIR